MRRLLWVLLVTVFYIPLQAQKYIQFVIIKQNGCKGTCPIYEYSINKSGIVIYEGKKHCDSLGKYKINIGAKKAKAILSKLERNKILTLPNSYPMRVADAPTFSYMVKTKKQEKNVLRANYGPEYLQKTKNDIEALIKKYKWIKLEE